MKNTTTLGKKNKKPRLISTHAHAHKHAHAPTLAGRRNIHVPFDVRSRQSTERVEAEVRVLAHDWPPRRLRGELALLYSDVDGVALELWQVSLRIQTVAMGLVLRM